MNAFIQIISQLVEAIPESVWRQQCYFDAQHFSSGKAQLMDACLFRQSASGALGFLWLEFGECDAVMLLPFRLSRYSEDGDLITLAPWSLREALGDGELYEAWRISLHSNNPIRTAMGGSFRSRFSGGEPAILALAIWGDRKNACVRVECQEAYKIFRRFSKSSPDSIEVEILEYLTRQTQFFNFPKLVSIFEYSSPVISNSHAAISMKYIQNSGTLWQDITTRIQHARFPNNLHERSGRESWEYVIKTSEVLGRMLGEFHRVMVLARDNPNLVPEANLGSTREEWLHLQEQEFVALIAKTQGLGKQSSRFGELSGGLPDFAKILLNRLTGIANLGLKIRTHGHLHLGQILVGSDQLFLIDFESDDQAPFKKEVGKQSCLHDLASLILSVKYAWHMTERNNYSPIFEDFLDKESEFGRHVLKTKSTVVTPETYFPSLKEIERLIIRFYLQAVLEESSSSEMIPSEDSHVMHLYNVIFLKRILTESISDFTAGNPRFKVSLGILDDFMKSVTSSEVEIESLLDYV